MKNKTLATWITLLGGPLGLHRVYLYGVRDTWAWIIPIPSLLSAYGVFLAQSQGLENPQVTLLLPWFGLSHSACALLALVYGLTDCHTWNQRFNPTHEVTALAGQSNGLTVAALVCALFTGSIALLSTLAFTLQRFFEWSN